jgi:hypothetical protein
MEGRVKPRASRAVLARRLATGLPVWAVARSGNLPVEEVTALMWEAPFRELIGAWEDIFRLSREERAERLDRLAHLILEDALGEGDRRAAMFVRRERRRRRDPVASLAGSFGNIVEHERARADRLAERIGGMDAVPPAPPAADPASPEPAGSGPAAQAATTTARQRRSADPVDAALWRKAAELRQRMFDEDLLRHAVAAQSERELRRIPRDADAPPAGPGPVGTPRPGPDAATVRENLAAALRRKNRQNARRGAGWPKGP